MGFEKGLPKKRLLQELEKESKVEEEDLEEKSKP